MTKYQKLVQRIDELLDGEVMRLEFGCRVERCRWKQNGPGPSEELEPLICIITGVKDDNIVYCSNGKSSAAYDLDNVKILGKPITLAMILRCLETVDGLEVVTDLDGYFRYYETLNCENCGCDEDVCRLYEGFKHYDLTKDSLDQQSDEFKNWLADLLLTD